MGNNEHRRNRLDSHSLQCCFSDNFLRRFFEKGQEVDDQQGG